MARLLRAYAGLVPVVLLVALLLGFGIYSRNATRDVEYWVDHTESVLQHLQQLLQSVVDAETGARGYILSQSDDALVPYNTARQTIPRDIEAIEHLMADNPQQVDSARQLAKIIQSKIDVLTPRSIRIETQGIADDLPFNYVIQARRVGECSPRQSAAAH